jgi:hypothetical protein
MYSDVKDARAQFRETLQEVLRVRRLGTPESDRQAIDMVNQRLRAQVASTR